MCVHTIKKKFIGAGRQVDQLQTSRASRAAYTYSAARNDCCDLKVKV